VCGGWDTRTISSVEQLGRVVKATISASIRWIRLIICIWMSRVRVLVYCLQVITWLVGLCILNYKIVCNCMINHFPLWLTFLFVVCLACVVLSFCNDYQFISVSRCEKSSWPTGKWWLHCIACLGWIPFAWAFLLGLRPCIALSLNFLLKYCRYIMILC